MAAVFLCQQFVSCSMEDEWPAVSPASTPSTGLSLSQITSLLLLRPPLSLLSYLPTCSSSACTLSSSLPLTHPLSSAHFVDLIPPPAAGVSVTPPISICHRGSEESCDQIMTSNLKLRFQGALRSNAAQIVRYLLLVNRLTSH